jgi:hypothetical protein
VSGRYDPARRRARGRIGTLAAVLRADLGGLHGDVASRGPIARRARGTVVRLEETFAFGMRFDFAPDAELTLLDGHARNAVSAIRLNIEEALRQRTEPALRARRLRLAVDLVDDLVRTVDHMTRRAQEIEAGLPGEPWSCTWAGRLLGVAAALLPSDHRRAFLEDQCGNLAQASSRREWLGYLAGVLLHMPAIAAATIAAVEREQGPAAGWR